MKEKFLSLSEGSFTLPQEEVLELKEENLISLWIKVRKKRLKDELEKK